MGDLATRANEAVKFEDSDLVVGRVDSLVQHFPEFKRKSEFKGEAWKALSWLHLSASAVGLRAIIVSGMDRCETQHMQ